MKRRRIVTIGKGDKIDAEKIDALLHDYIDTLPPMKEDQSFDQRILEEAANRATRIRHSSRFDHSTRSNRWSGYIRSCFPRTMGFSPTQIGWAWGLCAAALLIIGTILVHQHWFSDAPAKMARDLEKRRPMDNRSIEGKDDITKIKSEVTDTESGDRPTPGSYKRVRLAAVPVVFAMRGSDVGEANIIEENMATAMDIIGTVLERNRIEYSFDTQKNIVTNLTVRDAVGESNDQIPIRFRRNFERKSIVIEPSTILINPESSDAMRLESLLREIRIEIEDELRY